MAGHSTADQPVLDRRQAGRRPAASVRIVQLGLGAFSRAHQAWYTDLAPDASQWGIAAFSGRSSELAQTLAAQDGLYTLITRAPEGDSGRIVGSLSAAHAGTDSTAWTNYLTDPTVAIVLLTITEAGYLQGPDGGLNLDDRQVQADLQSLRTDPDAAVRTAPARLVAGLARRRAATGTGLAIVSCDNLPGNGAVAARVVGDFAHALSRGLGRASLPSAAVHGAAVDRGLAGWIADQVSFVPSMVDRITPAGTAADPAVAAELTGYADGAPVVTEPYSEWVLAGSFPGGRPDWESAGARMVPDLTPFEQRKLWLLNGGHSLLAYTGSVLGHATIAEAVNDPRCRQWLLQWWSEASTGLSLPAGEVAAYRAALLERFGNPRIAHQLSQIAADGSVKLPVRIVPTLVAQLAAGAVPTGGLRVVAGWICSLRGLGAPVRDPAAQELRALAAAPDQQAAAAVLNRLAPELGASGSCIAAVTAALSELSLLSATAVGPTGYGSAP